MLKVDAYANWTGPPGDCDDGLGQSDPKQQIYSNSILISERQSGTQYLVKSVGRGGHVTYTVSPSSHAFRGTCNAGASVALTPIQLTLTGPQTTERGNYECMIGKGVRGTLSAGTYSIRSGSYQWSIRGTPFQNYLADNSLGTVCPVTSQEPHADSPHWFWKIGEPAAVSCTAILDLPDGTSLSVSGQARCSIYAPDSAFGPHQLSSQCYYDVHEGNRTIVSWDPNSVDDFDLGFCIEFYGSVKTPDRFWDGNDSGGHTYVQLTDTDDISSVGGFPISKTTNGEFWLDNAFPYPGIVGGPIFPANIVMANALVARDGPSLGLPSSVTSFTMDEHYKMYQLYRPPGYDVAWVPLNLIEWDISAYGGYPWPGQGSAVSGSFVQISGTSATSNHPEWERFFGNTGSGNDRQAIHVRKIKETKK